MKSFGLVGWAIALILAACLFKTCHDGPEVIWGVADTTVTPDTVIVERVIRKPVPYAVYYEKKVGLQPDSNVIHDEYFLDGLETWSNSTTLDSMRLYADSTQNASAKAVVNSVVRGELLNQRIRLESYSSDTMIRRVDTLIKKVPQHFAFSVTSAFDIYNGLGVGASMKLKRWNVGYTYFLTRSHQIGVGYEIFGR